MHLITLSLLAVSFAGEPKLTTEEAKHLDRMLAKFLFDPTGAEWVRGEFPIDNLGGKVRILGAQTRTREGWLVRDKKGQKDRVVFAEGESVLAPADFKGVDFLKACRNRYAEEPDEKEGLTPAVLDVVAAAWLHKLGHDDLAAKAFVAAQKLAAEDTQGEKNTQGDKDTQGDKVPDPVRKICALNAFADLVEAYRNHDDETVLKHNNLLCKLYCDVVKRDQTLANVKRLLDELNRRKKAGTFGKTAVGMAPNKLPANKNERIAALIASLDEVDIQERDIYGRVRFDADWRVKALIDCGEAAIPFLISSFATDERLTRSVDFQFWTATPFDFQVHTSCFLHPVRKAERFAIESILRVKILDPFSGETLDHHWMVADATDVLWRYWDAFGQLPFDERMTRILTNPKSSGAACQEAATNLSSLREKPNGWFPLSFVNPTIAKYSNPTTAEAMLAAMDRTLKTNGIQRDETGKRYDDVFLDSMVKLGDRRIAPILAKRSVGAETTIRLRFASAAIRLGEAKPLEELARDFEAGSMTIPEPAKTLELTPSCLAELVDVLSTAGSPSADRALSALADPKHPYYKKACDGLTQADGLSQRIENWFQHPYWLAMARRMLDDTTLTGGEYRIDVCTSDERGVYKILYEYLGYMWSDKRNSGFRYLGLPESLTDATVRQPKGAERVCDRIAIKISESVIGFPAFHVLRRDRDAKLAAVKEGLDRFGGRFRRLSDWEKKELGFRENEPAFAPIIEPLAKGATADDVTAGRAVFQLNGKGQPARVSLLALVTLRKDASGKVSRGLAVQAETGPDGTITYGVLLKYGTRVIQAAEVEKIEPVAR